MMHYSTSLLSLLLLPSVFLFQVVSGYYIDPPTISPATGLQNRIYEWKQGQKIRYQVSGPKDGNPVLLVHGLFVNSDHWRKTIKALSDEGYRAYAIDLWGCGYSSKPNRDAIEAQAINGENRFLNNDNNSNNDNDDDQPVFMKNVKLGSANGDKTRIVDVQLTHPIKSPYNFYTWSELITDFCEQIVNGSDNEQQQKQKQEVSLVCNSIGTISSLQAILDKPTNFNGVFIVSPNFRELHSAEVPLSNVAMPIISQVQSLLRNNGQPLFDSLAKPNIVKQILMEPYRVQDAVDDTLVEVLLEPLLTTGASDVVFDTLSYSAGPLPEQQLSMYQTMNMHEETQSDGPVDKPIWICYGKDDPWTPAKRVEALSQFSSAIERIEGFDGVGHCPHDEAPEMVNPLLMRFLQRVGNKGKQQEKKQQQEEPKNEDKTINGEVNKKNSRVLFFAEES